VSIRDLLVFRLEQEYCKTRKSSENVVRVSQITSCFRKQELEQQNPHITRKLALKRFRGDCLHKGIQNQLKIIDPKGVVEAKIEWLTKINNKRVHLLGHVDFLGTNYIVEIYTTELPRKLDYSKLTYYFEPKNYQLQTYCFILEANRGLMLVYDLASESLMQHIYYFTKEKMKNWRNVLVSRMKTWFSGERPNNPLSKRECELCLFRGGLCRQRQLYKWVER